MAVGVPLRAEPVGQVGLLGGCKQPRREKWMTVAAVEPDHILVLRATTELPSGRSFDPRPADLPRAYLDGIWGFYLRPAPGGTTRLVAHTHSRNHLGLLGGPFSMLVGEPAHFIMQTRQFHGLRTRRRAGRRRPHMITGAARRAAAACELWCLSATELAAAIRSRQVSSREVIGAHLRRIEAVNPLINAVTVVLGEQALQAAKAADRAAARGEQLPPFHGVPFTVKENIDLADTATTQGAQALAGAYPSRDAPVVERLKAAGAIPVGRTNLPTYGVGWVCESELYGATVNPWDRSRTPGASSGGEAAALAAGMTPLGLGNDGFGSLRWPSQCCGMASLKPTLGRIPHAATVDVIDMPISGQLLEVEGPLARRVADLRAAFQVLAGPTWRDPWTVPAPLRGPEPPRPVRVALVVDPAGQGIAGQVREGCGRRLPR